MGFQQLTLVSQSATATFDSNGSAVDIENANGDTRTLSLLFDNNIFAAFTADFQNSNADFTIEYDFGENDKQYIGDIEIQLGSTDQPTAYTIQLSEDGTNYTTVHTVTSDPGTNVNLRIFGAGNEPGLQNGSRAIAYRKFKINFTAFSDSSECRIAEIKVYTMPLNELSFKDYNVEFDDSLLDMASWKNPRYEGSKLTGTRINYYTEGDRKYPYGLKPIIENKVCAFFVGNSIQGGGAATASLDPLVEIKNHSYVTIDTVVLCNLKTGKVTKISHEQFNETEEKKESFRRMIADNFPEGSKIVTKLINNLSATLVKESHRVKFNQGLLMKLYAYTANEVGVNDGVFGGFGVINQKGILTNNIASGSTPGGGLFGFGSTNFSISSLFNGTNPTTYPNPWTTINQFPSELSIYGDIGKINSLCEITASNTPPPVEPLQFSYLNPTQKVQ
tara:strand:- start:2173 stop:3513 length:1341 start_codon:yes stop_codon:yes gene_type:complete